MVWDIDGVMLVKVDITIFYQMAAAQWLPWVGKDEVLISLFLDLTAHGRHLNDPYIYQYI